MQHPKGLALATLPWAGQMVAAQSLPASSDGVQQVALGAGPAAGPHGPVDLDHPLTLVGQEAGQASAVAAGALQRPAAAARCSLGDNAQKGLGAGLVAGDLQLGDQPAVRVQDGGGVAIAVGVDPDDVIDLASSMGTAVVLLPERRPWSAPAWVQVTARQDWEGS